ncbi:ribosome biogenesis factor YjgA [Halomonas piscis]|uniref:Dual-action ribosomal maturation protein DarP n=1 Tax=Halomonas piscis TaxID=3031727 RepID=A0ABY9Z3D1_9GAMM|nr:ribosome biogenesis factor YjgA [Halomonas piscis]WNK21387.1 ribosome biogenesis factor YjgA [Halomonas piscis]
MPKKHAGPASEIPDERPSKTQLKREMHELQALGETLIAMKPAERARFALSDDLQHAIEETARIPSREARRRHMQYVGKLMRREDLPAIRAEFDAMEQERLWRDQAFHRLEAWRDRLVDEGDPAVDAFLEAYPDADRQTLRQLIRNARREREQQKPPSSARKLFRHLRESAELKAQD